MKVLLHFNTSGIHEERITNLNVFKITDYPEFNSYKEYSDFIVLFNSTSTECNCVKLPFTPDTFNGSILIIKMNKNKKITTFHINKYLRLLNTKGIKNEEYSSNSSDDEDPFINSCNLQKTEC